MSASIVETVAVKTLTANVLRDAGGDFTNGGVTSMLDRVGIAGIVDRRTREMKVLGAEEIAGVWTPERPTHQTVSVVVDTIMGATRVRAVPHDVNGRVHDRGMFGGNFITISSGSLKTGVAKDVFGDAMFITVPVFDRFE